MHKEEVKVRTGGKVVEVFEVDLFDSIDELMATAEPKKILDYYNRQHTENERNLVRAKHQPSKAGKQRRYELGFQVAFKEFGSDLQEVMQKGEEAVREFILSDRVQERVTEMLSGSLEE